MAWTRNNRMISFICSLFVNFEKLFKFIGIQVSEYHVNFNAENEECQIEMDQLSNNSLLSQARHQTGQPTVDCLDAGFVGNVANEYHVNFNVENEERRIEMDPLGNNSLLSQARHQTRQPTVDCLDAGFVGNVANEYHVNFNAENEERRIEMDPLSNNCLPSQARHQTGQPTVDCLDAEFDGNVANEYHVNFNAENEEHQIEMDQLSNNSLLSQARHQTGQPTVDCLDAEFDGNVANEVHQAGAEIITPQQTERATIPEPSFQLDQSRPTQTINQDETFKSGVKVAFWATSISASGVTAVWTKFLVNQPNSPKCKFFAKAALLSMSASFISGLLTFILSFIRPKFDATSTMVKIFMFAAIGSTALVVGFGVVFYFEKSG